MNVKCWGPTAWFTLHKISANYPINPTPNDIKLYYKFFSLLRYILPCKHCRKSYSTYYKELDITNYLDSRDNLMYWLYQIHNKVNEKLRNQGYLDYKNPSFDSVKQRYLKSSCSCCSPCFLNTLNCVAFNYNHKQTSSVSIPGLLEQKRMYEFLHLMRFIIPCQTCKKMYNDFLNQYPPRLENKGSFIRYTYSLSKFMERNKNCNKKIPDFSSFCDYYISQNSSCNNNSCRI